MSWYNLVSGGQWATWPPGSTLSPGDIGTFDLERRFRTRETLAAYGIAVEVSGERPVAPKLYRSGAGFRFQETVNGQPVTGGGTLGQHDGGVRLTAEEPNACLLHVLDATEKRVLNGPDVLDDVLALLRRGKWSIDAQIVIRRTRSRRGFAAVSREAGQSIELKTTGSPRAIIEAAEVDGADWVLASGATTGFLLHEFSDLATAVFGPPVRVRQSLWGRLLPWQAEGSDLTDPAGRRYPAGQLPQDLSYLPPEARRYDPARSAMRPAELSRMIAAAVFEEVTSLPESLAGGHPDGVAWGEAHRRVPAGSGMLLGIESFLAGIESFDLPRPSGDAAGRADGLPVVLLETASPDGAVGFSLHDRGMREYWLEVSLAPSNRPPAVVALRYGTVSQGQQDLLIPVDDDGSGLPSSVVSLPGYAIGATWRAWPALPHDSLGTWPDEVVARSVRAAITVATAQAWERLACAVPPDTGQVITRELRAIRGSR